MRKLRRLPWRIPKAHDRQPPTSAPAPTPAEHQRAEPQRAEPRESYRDMLNTQPVAFAGGRYVYGETPSVSCSTEIRRKTRHRVLAIPALTPQV
ncbi:MAG TPA: hypothetical protein VM164_09095 [Burkholderiales bacterium]|nr:hypothetical protein [Burkholderiales bacterium]